MMFHEEVSSVQHSLKPPRGPGATSADLSERHLRNPPNLKPTQRDPAGLQQMFSQKQLRLMKHAMGAISDQELLQKLADPPKHNRPSTNMNKSGNLRALKLTYRN